MGGALTRTVWRRLQRPLTLSGAVLLVAVIAGLPFLSLAVELAGAGRESLALLGETALWKLFFRSLTRAAAVTAGALLLGVPLGLILARSDAAGRRLCWLAHAFPLFVPPFLVALGWFYLLGRSGPLGNAATASLLFSEAGVVGVLTLTFTPVVTSLVGVALRSIDPALEEAARVVAPPLRVVTGVLLPAARPAAALGGLVVFALTVSELGVPMFLRSRAYNEAVFARLGGIDYDPGEAVVLALPLLALGLVLVGLERRWFGARRLRWLGLRTAGEPLPFGSCRLPATLAAAGAAVLAVAPVAALAWKAAAGGGFAQLSGWLSRSHWNSLATAAAAAATATALGVVLGHALIRGSKIAAAVDGLLFVSFLSPAAVLGVGIIATWNHPGSFWIYRTLAVLVVAAVARYAVLALRVTAVAFSQTSPRMEEAARVAGAGYLRRLLRIVLPVHLRGVVAAFLLVFVFCLRDLDTSVLFYPPGGETLSVRIFTLEANGPQSVIAALALVQILMAAGVLAAGGLLIAGKRRA